MLNEKELAAATPEKRCPEQDPIVLKIAPNNTLIGYTSIKTYWRKNIKNLNDGSTNPYILSILARGYQYQQALHISDRYGFFSHQSSHLHQLARKSCALLLVSFIFCHCVVTDFVVTSWMWYGGLTNAPLVWFIGLLVPGFILPSFGLFLD
ncbi:hypothetical protein EJ08DRAFT_650241 [Tothia fuscella]|uniref:Uncharacterized protein n=1 Tax=Tothia fuscella TaxID=1048955 RepID=A0A9P4NQU8_9PEZI|nr:hypothetical protein EJ08DRAFT_650241 [Tothia fuscella]